MVVAFRVLTTAFVFVSLVPNMPDYFELSQYVRRCLQARMRREAIVSQLRKKGATDNQILLLSATYFARNKS
jgi:hypothetical protein